MAQKKANANNNGQRVSGCLIWFILFLVVLLLFVLNWEKIKKTVDETRFGEAIVSTKDETDKKTGDGSLEPEFVEKKPEPKQKDQPQSKESPVKEKPIEQIDNSPKEKDIETEAKPVAEPKLSSDKEKREENPASQLKATRVSSLYYVRIEEDGSITRHEVKRTLEHSDSPMTDALIALLKGPNTDEISRGLLTLIPTDVRLISAEVRGSTAYINLSEEFMYNHYGIEGYAGQIKQIVYTATSFSTVKDVQILIEGQRYEYLGGDGVYIGKALSRNSF